jgi:hypothetical protein
MAARNVTFQSVLDGVAARIGLDPTQTLAPSTAAAITEYINTRVRFAWESYRWPDMSAIEKRQFRETYDASKSYSQGNEVFYLGNYYRRTAAGSGSGVLPTVTATWTISTSLTDFVRNLDYDQTFTASSNVTAATPIGEILYVYAADPRITRYAERVNFWVTDGGAVVGGTQFSNTSPNEVFVEFTTRPTTYTTSSGSANVPRVISEYVKFAASADALREDGQFDKAAFMDALAVDALAKEVDIIELKQGQTRLMGNRRDLFPTNATQKASSSPTGLQLNRAAGANTAL